MTTVINYPAGGCVQEPPTSPTPAEQAQAKTQISRAKAALILEQPFFASLLVNMPMIEDNSIPTMATNGKQYRYNVKFVLGMTPDETKFVLCHEVGHCIHQHMHRRGSRNHKRWNIAGDYIINDMLVQEKIGSMPEGGLHNPQLVAAALGTTDGVYDLLPEDTGKGPGQGPGEPGGPMDDCEDAPGSDAERAADYADIKVKIAQAAQAAKMCGKLSAGLARFAGQALKPKVNWKDVTRRFWTAKAKTEFSYARPKRRFLAEDIYLPSLAGEQLGEMVLAFDMSGSVGQREQDMMLAEAASLIQDCAPSVVHVICFESKVSNYERFEKDDMFEPKLRGCGGTAFSPIFAYVDEHGINATACIVLTDLCCSDFGPQPGYPVLWVTTEAGTAPWGEVVEMNPKQ